MNHSFDQELDKFVTHTRGLEMSLPLVMSLMLMTNKVTQNLLHDFLKNKKVEIENLPNGQARFTTKPEYMHSLKKLNSKASGLAVASHLLPRSFITTLVSQFDAFLGRLIRTIFYVKPEKLNASEKNLTFSEIIKFESLDHVKEYIIEKEVESVLRKSHSEQFDWLESKLKMKLREGLEIWPCFIEVTERRNLFVHCDGAVSSQYLKVCQEHGVKFDHDIKVGDILPVSNEYFQSAYECVFEIGVKLAQVIWRKLQPEDLSTADRRLNDICYELILNKDYFLAQKLLHFGTDTLKKHSSEDWRLTLVINKAQAFKWSGDGDRCKKVINKIDWSAYSNQFKLASFVLLNKFDEASNIMERIGSDGEVKKIDYRDWPLFKEFRKSDQFLTTFSKVFNEEFQVAEEVGFEITVSSSETEKRNFREILIESLNSPEDKEEFNKFILEYAASLESQGVEALNEAAAGNEDDSYEE